MDHNIKLTNKDISREELQDLARRQVKIYRDQIYTNSKVDNLQSSYYSLSLWESILDKSTERKPFSLFNPKEKFEIVRAYLTTQLDKSLT